MKTSGAPVEPGPDETDPPDELRVAPDGVVHHFRPGRHWARCLSAVRVLTDAGSDGAVCIVCRRRS